MKLTHDAATGFCFIDGKPAPKAEYLAAFERKLQAAGHRTPSAYDREVTKALDGITVNLSGRVNRSPDDYTLNLSGKQHEVLCRFLNFEYVTPEDSRIIRDIRKELL